ncbi:hypothetical protein J4457_05895 [Candidatus Woesearchaeota archaeon]|nr:hypothetical protein [Candidatus Woesearchaeota archaeon]
MRRMRSVFLVARTVFIIAVLLTLPGCLGDLLEFSCIFIPDSSHCYQSAAVQDSDPYGCEKVTPPKEFASSGSNPPRDKCYLQIAQNTGDYDVCSNIKGGIGSYTKEECVGGIAVKNEDPEGCKRLTGEVYEDCKKTLGALFTTDRVKNLDEEIDDLKSQVGRDPDDADLRKQLEEAEKKRKGMIEFMEPTTAAEYNKGKIAEVMEDVEDEDVASEIRKDFVKYKAQSGDRGIDSLTEKLKAIKEEKEFIKNVDDQANTLVDQLKESVGEYADEQKEELVDAAKEKGWDWVKTKGGDRFKDQLEKLEEMKGKYDKASDKYEEIAGKIEKLKKVYDEVSGVYKKVDEYNKMLAEGKIDKGQAKVLKGAVLLGKGLEYATEYVPVFGSTISAVTKGTFDATIKLATKRAQRNKKLNDCIDDPEHCDPNGISPY